MKVAREPAVVAEGTVATRGTGREARLDRGAYFSDVYFSERQLFSFTEQLTSIHALKPADILEIGLGNGFVSSFLKRAGYDVTTADINAALEPDICAPLSELPAAVGGRKFDLVVCCEVLEHMPWSAFRSNVAILSQLAKRAYITLPTCVPVIGIAGNLRFPKLKNDKFGIYLPLPVRKAIDPVHFWELGSSRENTIGAVRRILSEHFGTIRAGRVRMNPYHVYFKS